MSLKLRALSAALAVCISLSGVYTISSSVTTIPANAAESIEDSMDWGTLKIGGGGFVSGIVTGQKEMYLRTDVGGAYKYNYEKNEWEQLFGFLNEADRGLLSVKGMAIDPTDDNTVYFLCGCAYFSGARTVIFKTTDGGKTFTESDVTDMIQVHGNGDGRECCEPVAVDPDNPDTIYAGGDVTAGESALIKSTDGGKTWKSVKGYDDLGLFTESLKYPMWTEHMVRGTEAKEYNQQNGIATVHIEGGKVYVGTSVTGQTNIHVADVDKDEFTELSADLPTANYPVTISSDNNGNLFFTYIAGLAFSGGAGGAYKYNIASGKVTDISPASNAIGMITADKNDPDKLLARTCGVWSDQWYEKEWTDTSIAWGDHFFRSEDGGDTWTNITPGKKAGDWGKEYFISEPIDTNGYDWIYGKACHWGSGILIDPRDSDRILMTSGNGVFACDNVWAEQGVQFYFQPDGVEEVVALDMVSVPGGDEYSAIGDYDGYKHTSVDEIGIQHKPNMGSTGAIAYCPQNPDVMVRFAENEAKGYYTTDAGTTWNEMSNAGGSGGKAGITQLEDGSYRIFHTSGYGKISYSDDFGATWSDCTGTATSKTPAILVEPEKPNIVYAYSAKYNDYWASDTTKKEPSFDDANYQLMVSTDYGATFTSTGICKYDMCDVANRIAYLGEGKIVLGAGWNGAYISTDYGKTVTKLDSVFYCKTIGYGAPEKAGDVNTLYIYGKPQESDPEGIYRSQDSGKTWVLINTQNLYGGTGNGNFLVGDMDEFGTVYMSTVGCGIVYGKLSDSNPDTTKPTTTTTTASASKPTTTTTKTTTTSENDILWGDVNVDGKVEIADVVAAAAFVGDSENNPLDVQGIVNGDVQNNGDGITAGDVLAIQQYLASIVKELPVK